MTTPNSYPALQLNADFRPMATVPLSIWGWQDAVKAVISDSVIVLAEHDFWVHGSPTSSLGKRFEMRLPSVLALKDYQSLDRPVAFTRISIAVRDGFRCSYCQSKLTMKGLTFDHVVPRSLGGRTTFQNIASACDPCNGKKANRSLRESGLTLHRKPFVPTREHLNVLGMAFPPPASTLHRSWLPYLNLPDDYMDKARVTEGPMKEGSAFPADFTSADYWNVGIEP